MRADDLRRVLRLGACVVTATLNGKVNGSAYPVPVEQLLPRAQKLTEELGSVPSRNRLMTELKIGRDKANTVLAELVAEPTAAPGPDLSGGIAPTHAPAEASPLVAEVAAPGPEPMPMRGRWWAWAAFLLGSVASLAANVAHAQPQLGPRLTAAFAPLALVLAVELAARVAWRPGLGWAVMRWGGTGLVAAVTAVVSYRTQVDLFGLYGEDKVNATILPLSVDGLMLVAAGALLTVGRRTPEGS